MGNRKAATAELLKWIDKLMPGSPNKDAYEKQLKAMSEHDFDAFMKRLESGEQILHLIAPNFADLKLDIRRNLAIADELGHKFFERLWLTDSTTGKVYLTPVRALVVDLPVRRQQQMLVKKISIPEDNRHIDELSGQPTGPSRSARISFPELQVLNAQGMDKSLIELIKLRGGDNKAFQAMNRSIIDTGGVSIDSIERVPSRVKSTETLSTILKAMHLENTV